MDATALMVKWVKERRKWGPGAWPLEKKLRLHPLNHWKIPLKSCLRTNVSLIPCLAVLEKSIGLADGGFFKTTYKGLHKIGPPTARTVLSR